MGGNEGFTDLEAVPKISHLAARTSNAAAVHRACRNAYSSSKSFCYLPAMAQHPDTPEPSQDHANPVTVSHAALHMLDMATIRPPHDIHRPCSGRMAGQFLVIERNR